MDIARLVPVIGALLFAVPLMWPDPDPYPAPDTSGAMPMSSAITYVFLVWAALIGFSYAFGVAVRRWADHWTGESEMSGAPTEGNEHTILSSDELGNVPVREK